MAQNAQEILQTRNLVVYYKAYNAANALPTAAAYGTPWTGYTDAGLTDGGLSVSIAHSQEAVKADQLFDPAFFVLTDRTITLSTQLAQMSPALMNVASGMGTISSTPAASGTRGNDTLTINGTVPNITDYSVGFEAQQQDGEAAQGLVLKGMPSGTLNFNVGQATQKSLIPLEVTALAQATATDPVFIYRDITPALP